MNVYPVTLGACEEIALGSPRGRNTPVVPAKAGTQASAPGLFKQ